PPHPVPPGGGSHAARPAGAFELPVRDRAPERRLEHEGLSPAGGDGDPNAGRRGPRAVRALGRGGQLGGGDPVPPRGGGAALVRARGPRPPAARRSGGGATRAGGKARAQAHGGGRARAIPRASRGRGGSRAQAQDHRRGVHPGLRGGGEEARAGGIPGAGHALPGRDRARAGGVYIEELRRAKWYARTWQAFAVLLPVHSVGVKGDERSYERVVALRAVDSSDGMTADWTRLPHGLLARVASRIANEVRGVN